MEEIKTIIEMLDKIRASDNKTFNNCPENKLLHDLEYGQLYQAFWQADVRIGNVIKLLKAIDTDYR